MIHRNDITLLKNAGRTNVSNMRHNDELSDFFLKDLIIKDFFNKLLKYVTPASTVDGSTLFACCINVGFVRFMAKVCFILTNS